MKRNKLIRFSITGTPFQFLLLFLTLAVPNTHADTPVTGVISSDTLWGISGSPYSVTGNVLVNAGVTLVIDSGVIVKFASGKSLQVAGTLKAIGSGAKHITFGAAQGSGPGTWGIINFTSISVSAVMDSMGNYISGSIMKYCDISSAGGLGQITGAIKIDSVAPRIENCRIENNRGSGIYALAPPFIVLWRNRITGNERVGDVLSTTGAGIFIQGGSALIDEDTVSNNTAYQRAGGISLHEISDTTSVVNNRIEGNSGDGDQGGTGGIWVIGNTSYVDIYNNVIVSNRGSSGHGYEGGGIKVTGNKSRVNINVNFISGNTGGSGIDCGTHGFGPTGSAYLFNNTICNNSPYGIYIHGSTGLGDTTRILINYIHDNIGDGINIPVATFNVTNNYIYSNRGAGITLGEAATGFNPIGPLRRNTLINNDKWALALPGSSAGGGLVSKNLIVNSGSSAAIYSAGNSWTFNYNNLFNYSASYAVEYHGLSGNDLDAKNNWWNTSIDSLIQSKIFDWNEDISLGFVQYSPILGKPDTIVPISPPMNVRCSFVDPGCTVTWDKNPENRVAGYKIYFGDSLKQSAVISPDSTTFAFVNAFGLDTIAVTTFDKYADGKNDQLEGHESWFSFQIIKVLVRTVEKRNRHYVQNLFGLSASRDFIRYNLPVENRVRVSLFTVRGQWILDLIVGRQAAGEHHAALALGSVPNGIYILHAIIGETTWSRPFVFVK